jgi:ATP-dependent Lon protease
MMRNPDFTINAIGLYGGKGLGKTQIVKSISEALHRPYRTISLGGESDSTLLTGHGFTYVGSCPGRIIEILRETKCTNPIILFDELDKVSQTHHGKEIIGNLIHLTDTTTNNKYNYDKYFAGIEFDLSKVLFVFTYNDASKVDPILADRLFKIHVDNYSFKEKLEITKLHIIPNILEQYRFSNKNFISVSDEAVKYIVDSSKSDQGMRDIKRKFEIVVSRVNTLLLTKPEDNIVKLKYKSLYSYYNKDSNIDHGSNGNTSSVCIIKDHIDILLSDSATNDSDNIDKPPFGMYI